ncbi:MAG: tripartite tricarboxylate transporter substrate binding protein [Planctomycetes bacterium]|nr:tripartite tricarboxylate transporter substrate binding protein [Planctomycetota bacterium]
MVRHHSLRSLPFAIMAAAIAVGMAQPAGAASYPTKQITVLQGFKAGGGSDGLAQVTQPALGRILGTSFINQYLPGANSAIMLTRLGKQTRADGYTLGITCTPPIYTNYLMNAQITYTLDEFDAVANVVTDPGIIAVGADSPYQTFAEFYQACQERPGQVAVSHSGVGGDDFFAILMYEKVAGVKTKPIPFEGDGPSWQAAMAGKVEATFNNVGSTYPQVKGGNLRVLAICAEERFHLLPDVPTMRELGFDIIAGSSRGYGLPKGAPEEVKEILIHAFREMAEDSQFLKACEDRALVVDMKYGQDYMDMLRQQEQYYGELWDEVKDQYSKE